MGKVVVGVCVAIGLLLIVGFNYTPNEKTQDRRAVEFCYDEASRMGRALDASTSRFQYAACEHMRSEFIQKWMETP